MSIPRLLSSATQAQFRPCFILSKPRLFTTTTFRSGSGEKKPFVGPGAKPGTIPTDLEQSTGLERYEYLTQLQGKEAFDMTPLQVSHLGTPKNPIIVQSVDKYRYVGCTGFPVDSHDTIWLTVSQTQNVDRCPECGCCFQLKVIDPPSYPEIDELHVALTEEGVVY